MPRNRIQSANKTAGPLPVFDDADQCQIRAATQIQIHEIQTLDSTTIGRLKSLAGHGNQLHIWVTPRHWLAHGSRIESIESVDLRSAALSRLTAEEQATLDLLPVPDAVASLSSLKTTAQLVEGAVLQAIRYLLLLRLGPSAQTSRNSSTGSLKPALIATTAAGAIRRMVAIVVRKRLDLLSSRMLTGGDSRYFALIQSMDLTSLPKTFAQRCAAELQRMDVLSGRELWLDAPSRKREPTGTVDPTQPPMQAGANRQPEPHLPLPDEYVAFLGQRSHWIVEHLGPSLLKVGQQLLTEWRQAAIQGRKSKDTRKKIVLKVMEACFPDVSNNLSTNALGCPVPPFTFRLSKHGEKAGHLFKKRAITHSLDSDFEEKSLEAIAWPPRNLAHFRGLCATLQGAHLFISSLALAARQSESMDLLRDCVVYGEDGQWRANGRTFKLAQQFEGEVRKWDLPEFAARSIEQQGRLVRMLEQMPWSEDLGALVDPEFIAFEGNHLWCRIGTGNINPREVLRDPNKMLRTFARSLDASSEPGGQPLRTHRFRKTIARLSALAIDEAPVMLKQLFGHRDIEMTLHYILADKALAAEIDQVVKELHMMRARTPVEAFVAQLDDSKAYEMGVDHAGINYAGYGGKAVSRIADTVTRYRDQSVASGRMRNSATDFGADHIDDVVRILTGDGTYFNLVRPGVFCTKRVGEWGPCSRKKGQADRSNCQETCDHRLEEPWLRSDAEDCIEEALAGYERACAESDLLLNSFWADQLRRNVVRFEDLRAKWIQHPTIARLMESADTTAAKAT